MTQSSKQPFAGAPIHIQSGDYILRTLIEEDATSRFLSWLNNPEMLYGLNLPALSFSHEHLVAFVKSFDNYKNHLIGIFDKKSQLLIGFYTLDVNPTHKTANITTGIGEKDFQGKGVLWATIDALLDHFFVYRDVEKITARILARNRRILFNFIDNPRFLFEARLRQECVSVDGGRQDVLLFAAFKNMPKS